MIDIAVDLNLMSKDKADQVYKQIMDLRNSIPSDVWNKVMELREKIIKGEVEVPMPTADNIKDLRQQYG